MHLLKAEEILRIHDAVLERFGGLNSQPMTPDAEFSKAQALVGRIRTAMTYNTAYDWNNVSLLAVSNAFNLIAVFLIGFKNNQPQISGAKIGTCFIKSPQNSSDKICNETLRPAIGPLVFSNPKISRFFEPFKSIVFCSVLHYIHSHFFNLGAQCLLIATL